MYDRYYGFREAPFELTSNPRFLCFTPQHREALGHLENTGMSAAKPVTRADWRSGHRKIDAAARGARRRSCAATSRAS